MLNSLAHELVHHVSLNHAHVRGCEPETQFVSANISSLTNSV